MSVKAIHSSNPDKPNIVKTFKDKFSATKVTSVKYNTDRNTFFATCFRRFERLGLKEINAIEIEGISTNEQ